MMLYMMFNSFTSFDMETSPNHFMVITTFMIMMFMLFSPTKKMYSGILTKKYFSLKTGNLMLSQLILSSSGKYIKGFYLYMFSVYIITGPLNFMGLVPWMFAPTSHLMFTLAMSAPLWLSMIITSFSGYPFSHIAHFLPENTMPLLAPFLANIEQLSSIIRPITLAFRMSANISAGHVILALMGAFLTHSMFLPLSLTLLSIIAAVIMYFMFEIMVCIAQTYVFTLLSIMYTNDYIQKPIHGPKGFRVKSPTQVMMTGYKVMKQKMVQ